MSQLSIETHRLILHPFSHEDLEDLHRLWSDAQVRKYLWDDQIISREDAAGVIESSLNSFAESKFGFWRLNLRDSRNLTGFCGLRYFKDDDSVDREIEILYGVSPAQNGKGLATEASRAILKYGFDRLGLEKIYAGADAPNVASFRVMEKLGMKFERIMHLNGQPAVYYSVSRSDFEASDIG